MMLVIGMRRKQETEADIIGMDLAARACFDPAAGKHVFTRLGEIEKRMGADKMPSLLRTHPVRDSGSSCRYHCIAQRCKQA